MSVAAVFHSFKNNQKLGRVAVLIFGIALLVSAVPLEAGVQGQCLDALYGLATNCSANEGSISAIEIVNVTDGCISSTDTALIQVTITLSGGNTTRYDVGLYFNTVGGSAQTDTGLSACFHEALFDVSSTPDNTNGQGPFFDSDGDVCGETDTGNWLRTMVTVDPNNPNDPNIPPSPGTGPYAVTELNILCKDSDNNGYVDFSACSSYQANAASVCTSVLQTIPSAKSKCGCINFDTGIAVIHLPVPDLGLTIDCTPDTIGPGDYVDCTVTYTNSGNGPGDNIEYRIDFPDTGAVSMISTNGTDSARELTGDADGTAGSTKYIQLVPNDAATPTYVPSLANIPTPTTQTMTFRFTSSTSTPDGSTFDITAYTWFNNGTATTYQGQLANDTTQITPAVVSDFTTHRHRGQTLVQWQTVAETGTAGFYLERKDPANGQWHRVNEGLLPALLERPGGGNYAFLDTQAKPMNAQTYRLVAVDFNGSQEIHGPFERFASRSSGLENFDAKQSKGFARTAHQPSTAEVAAWDRKREARLDELSMSTSAKGLVPAGIAAPNARIQIDGEGLFSLSAVTLADHFGMSGREVQKAFRTGKLRLSHRGSPVAYLPSDDLDRVYFFGQEIDSRFTDENTYWATFDTRAGTPGIDLMDEIGGFVPPAVNTPQTFLSTTTFEEDIWLIVYAVRDPEADIWFGGFVSTGYYGNTTYVTDVTAPDAAADGQAEIRLELYGLTNLTAGNDHHAEVRLNGALIGEAVWDGVTPQTLVATFDQSILSAGSNSLEVNGVLDGDVEQSSFVIDTVELTYNRHYSALDDALIFGANGHRAITVDGFTGPDVEVFDLRSATSPIHVTGTTVEDSDAGYRVTFAPSSSDGLYLAVRRAAAAMPSSLEIDRPSKLRSPDNAAEYLVIAPASLQRGAQTLVDYRQQRFPDARLIDLQDVYDEFNAGIEDPSAIRSFLKFALGSWQTAPRFVVLAGKGTLDPKDFQGYGTNVLPLVLTSTPYGVFASDTRIGDVVGSDGVPDVAIGRIPALSSTDLENYVDKLRSYEASDNQGGQNALMLADNADGAGNFPADSLNVSASLPADVTPIHVVHQTGADADLTRQQVSNALDQGVMLFNFIGHGAVTQLGAEAFWAMPDIGGMTNNDRLPIFAAFSCYAGNGTFPGYNSITEEMTLLGSGGVIAALAPTGLSINNRAVVLNKAFIDALLDGGQTLGEATQSAIESLRNLGGPQFMQEIYNVVGDPAVEINR